MSTLSTSTRPVGLPRDYAILLDTCSEPCLPFKLTLPPISQLAALKPTFIQPLRTPPLSPQLSTTPPPSTTSIPTSTSQSTKNKIRCVHPNCTQTFQYPSQLKSHSVVHSGARLFRCSYPSCTAQYTTNNRLKIHARTHSGERPYKCTQCAYSAVQKCTLDSHMVTMHTSETAKSAWRMERLSRAVPCGVCAKMFKTRASLESHAWRFHGAAPTVKAKQD
ncbi:hypothetical protein CcCBS67573_g05126 [Chytriomyces confervae]|uniref:C2H2-type domain-containing protein n=1 Tax=Chytriomyces confervae TaxID=246404 RepID=A0A507FDF8_9FUNG|nr:hypothetical protein HDU80_008691 [Chytriomyces hyalinus]TPX73607.1 hypothetical protein CcCBS67573_g05126 [Chytriomyces confervae]